MNNKKVVTYKEVAITSLSLFFNLKVFSSPFVQWVYWYLIRHKNLWQSERCSLLQPWRCGSGYVTNQKIKAYWFQKYYWCECSSKSRGHLRASSSLVLGLCLLFLEPGKKKVNWKGQSDSNQRYNNAISNKLHAVATKDNFFFFL